MDVDGAALRLETHGRPGATFELKRTVIVRPDTCVGERVRHLRGAAETGGAAEPRIKRHGGIRSAHHHRNEAAAGERDQKIAANLRGTFLRGVCELCAFIAVNPIRPGP